MERKMSLRGETMQTLLTLIGTVDVFKGKWSALEQKESKYLKEFFTQTLNTSVAASARINGSFFKDNQIEAILSKVTSSEELYPEEKEALGFYEAMQFVMENYHQLDLSESSILSLHNMLMKFCSQDSTDRGQYKTRSNKVVIVLGGVERIIFNTTEPYLVPKEMQELLQWTQKQFKEARQHPLVITASFLYEFFAINPFQHGNERMMRLLTQQLLLQNGYTFVNYASFIVFWDKHKNALKDALMHPQPNRGTDKEVIDEWILFFVDSLCQLAHFLDEKYKAYRAKGPYLNSRQKALWESLQKHEPVKLGDLHALHAGFSINTIKKDLQYFLKEGIVMKMGQRKGTTYMVNIREDEF